MSSQRLDARLNASRGISAVLTGAVEVLGDGVQEGVLWGQEPLHYRHGYYPLLNHSISKQKEQRTKESAHREDGKSERVSWRSEKG